MCRGNTKVKQKIIDQKVECIFSAFHLIQCYSGPPHNEFNSFPENCRYVENSLCEFGKCMLKAWFIPVPSQVDLFDLKTWFIKFKH
jgi:hypothetical protein